MTSQMSDILEKLFFVSVISFVVVLLGLFIINSFTEVDNFKSSCEAYGGSYWEIANVTCSASAPNCRYVCGLNGEQFSMSDLGWVGLLTYSKQICIKDCNYKNKQAGETICVC